MALRVHVHVALWLDGHLVVHERMLRGRRSLTLPGGRVREHESVDDTLRRKVLEETGIEVERGDLLHAAEVTGTSRRELVLVFAGTLLHAVAPAKLTLLAPGDGAVQEVLPPIVNVLSGDHRRGNAPAPAWLGNLYDARRLPYDTTTGYDRVTVMRLAGEVD